MPQTPTVNRYRPDAGQPFPFPQSGSKWTLEHLKYIGIDHSLDCALDDIIPPKIGLSPKIAEYLNRKLNKPWEDLLTSEAPEDKEKFYAKLLKVAGPKSKGGPYDIPFTSSQLSDNTPPPEVEEPRTPEGGPSPMRPPRLSSKHTYPLGCIPSSPASPTVAKNTRNVPEATPQPSSDPADDAYSPQNAESDSSRDEEADQAKEDQAEKDIEALARGLLLLIENAVLELEPSMITETWYANPITT